MARGPRRSQTQILNDQLMKIDEKIAKYEEQLKSAKAEKKQLEAELKKTALDDLVVLMADKNLSVQQIKEIVENTDSAE